MITTGNVFQLGLGTGFSDHFDSMNRSDADCCPAVISVVDDGFLP